MFGIWLVICVDSNATTAGATFASTLSSFFKHCKRKLGWRLLKTKSYINQSMSGPAGKELYKLQPGIQFRFSDADRWQKSAFLFQSFGAENIDDMSIIQQGEEVCWKFRTLWRMTISQKKWFSLWPLMNAKMNVCGERDKLLLIFAYSCILVLNIIGLCIWLSACIKTMRWR